MTDQKVEGGITYIIPNGILEAFGRESLKNKTSNGHIETLALITGCWNGSTLIARDIIFPKQTGTSTEVEDKGKYIL